MACQNKASAIGQLCSLPLSSYDLMSQFCCAENILVTFISTTSLKYSFYWSKFHGGVNVTNISRTVLAKGLFFYKRCPGRGGDFRLFSLTSSALDHSATAPPNGQRTSRKSTKASFFFIKCRTSIRLAMVAETIRPNNRKVVLFSEKI